MRCAICDSDSDTVVYTQGEFTPCSVCQEAIYDCLQGYDDVEELLDAEV
jgi:hypothetical protein